MTTIEQTILTNLMRKFTFSLSESYKNFVEEHPDRVAIDLGVNLGRETLVSL